MRRAAARLKQDDGLGLVEMLVAMILMGVLGGMILSATLITHKSFRNTSDESQGLADVRKASERLARDIREARDVTVSGAAAASASQLSVWIDADSNYQKNIATEVVTWRLQAGTSAGQYNLVRIQNGVTRVEATSLVNTIAFSYCSPKIAGCPKTGWTASPASTLTSIDLVSTDMTYDAVLNGGTGSRHVKFITRLRNVE